MGVGVGGKKWGSQKYLLKKFEEKYFVWYFCKKKYFINFS